MDREVDQAIVRAQALADVPLEMFLAASEPVPMRTRGLDLATIWPLIVTNSVNSRPLTVGLQIFSSGDQGVDWSIITAATLMTSGPLLIGFLLFQRQFVQSFMRAGIS